MKEQEFKKIRQSLGTSGTTLNVHHLNHRGARGEEEEQEIENLFEKITENFPNLAKEIDFQEVQEAQRVPKKLVPTKLDPKRNTPRHIIIKLPKIKEENLKSRKRKGESYHKGVPIRLSVDFSKETLQAKRGWKEVFKFMNSKDLHLRLLYPESYHLEWKGRESASQIR